MTGSRSRRIHPSKSARPAATSPPWPSSRSTATARPLPLDEWSTFGEWADDPVGSKIVASVYAEGEAGNLPQLPDNDMMRMFLKSMPINSMPMLMSDGGKAITAFMLDEYAKIAETAE